MKYNHEDEHHRSALKSVVKKIFTHAVDSGNDSGIWIAINAAFSAIVDDYDGFDGWEDNDLNLLMSLVEQELSEAY